MLRLLILSPILLTACAGEAIGPSLAKRPIESRSMTEPVREAAVPAAADAELRTQIARLTDSAQAGQRAFAALLPRARSAASAAGPEGSESWITAQQLFSALENERAPTTRALADLDALIANRLKEGTEAGIVELQAADAEAAALVEAQQRELDSLRVRLSR
jgi:hypothetical protein